MGVNLMNSISKSLLFIIAFCFSSSTLSALKEDFWDSVDHSSLKFAQVTGGILLKNDCDCEIKDIELQTFPTSSNAAIRLLGYGSYYYEINSIQPGAIIEVRWDKFSNSGGQYLKLDQYSFDRISIAGRKILGKNKDYINQHFNINPNAVVENRGFKVSVKNLCPHPVKVAVNYKNTSGTWVTKSWWKFSQNESANLTSNNHYILTRDSRLYFYAETSNRTNIAWAGDKKYVYIGFKKYGMRAIEDSEGDTYLELTCNAPT